jgi:hypothetical protein
MMKISGGPACPRLGNLLSDPTRDALAWLLRRSSVRLSRWARALTVRAHHRTPLPMLEFHAEAGAPEGALYVDGVLVGHIHGVNRL